MEWLEAAPLFSNLWWSRLGELIQLLATFPIFVDIIGAERCKDRSEVFIRKCKARERVNRRTIQKLSRYRSLMIEKWMLRMSYSDEYATKREHDDHMESITQINEKISALNLGWLACLLSSFICCLIIALIFTPIALMEFAIIDLHITGFVVVDAIIMLLMIALLQIAAVLIVPPLVVYLAFIALALGAFFVKQTVYKLASVLSSESHGRIFSKISYIIFLVGFFIKFILG